MKLSHIELELLELRHENHLLKVKLDKLCQVLLVMISNNFKDETLEKKMKEVMNLPSSKMEEEILILRSDQQLLPVDTGKNPTSPPGITATVFPNIENTISTSNTTIDEQKDSSIPGSSMTEYKNE